MRKSFVAGKFKLGIDIRILFYSTLGIRREVNAMKKYILSRFLQAVIVIVGVTLITFIMVNIAPGDAATVMSEKVSDPVAIARINEQLGFDQPYHVQYLRFLQSALIGDFGISFFRHRPVMDLILNGFLVTGTLALFVLIFALVVGLTMGVIAALNHGKTFDQFLMGLSTLGMALPSFLLAVILQYIFGLKLRIVPLSGLVSWQSYILPTLTLGIIYSAEIARLTRTNMLGVLDEDYIRTAKAKGLSGNKIVFGHGLKNASVPILTYVGNSLKGILGGSVLVETVFGINGIGSLLVDAIMQRDVPIIQGVTVYIAIIFVLLNLAVDLIYGFIDPRIRLSGKES